MLTTPVEVSGIVVEEQAADSRSPAAGETPILKQGKSRLQRGAGRTLSRGVLMKLNLRCEGSPVEKSYQ